jgi:hypothetical protein
VDPEAADAGYGRISRASGKKWLGPTAKREDLVHLEAALRLRAAGLLHHQRGSQDDPRASFNALFLWLKAVPIANSI